MPKRPWLLTEPGASGRRAAGPGGLDLERGGVRTPMLCSFRAAHPRPVCGSLLPRPRPRVCKAESTSLYSLQTYLMQVQQHGVSSPAPNPQVEPAFLAGLGLTSSPAPAIRGAEQSCPWGVVAKPRRCTRVPPPPGHRRRCQGSKSLPSAVTAKCPISADAVATRLGRPLPPLHEPEAALGAAWRSLLAVLSPLHLQALSLVPSRLHGVGPENMPRSGALLECLLHGFCMEDPLLYWAAAPGARGPGRV